MRGGDRSWAPYAAVALAWLATRAIAVISVDMTPWMLNDLEIYQGWAPGLHDAQFPVSDPTWQYPPGIAPLFVLADSLRIDYRWGFTLAILAVDAALMAALLVAHARREDASWRGPWLWAMAGLVIGPIMVVRFDLVPTALAAVALLLAARPVLSGISLGLGALTKVWPALMLIALPRRSLPRGILGVLLVVVPTLAVTLVATRDSLSFLGNQQSRGLQVESVGALPYHVWNVLGGDVDYGYRYGSIQVLMSGAETAGLALTLLGLLLIAALVVLRLAGRLEQVLPADVGLAVLLVSVATSRVYSPQFNVWLIGVAAVAVLDSRTRMRWVAGILIAVSLLTQVVYPWSATQLVTGDVFTTIVQSLRILGLLLATGLALVAVLTARPTPRRRTPQPR